MRKVAQFLHVVSRVLAICAVLAGVGAGLLQATIGAGLICFDYCPTREGLFSWVLPGTVRLMTPCVVLEVLALAVFLAYCVTTHQPRRTIASIRFFLIGGLVGVAALAALLQLGQATLPVNSDGILLESEVIAWAQLWGWVLLLVAGAWSGGVLAYLQGAAE